MAQRTVITLEDDIDGGPADETVTFGLDGSTYEIDLTSANADKLRGVLYDYTAKARRLGKATGKAGKRSSGVNNAEIRDWARSNGIDVPERGRLPKSVIDQFEAR